MRIADSTLWLAPTDLTNHLDCRHLTSLALAHARGAGPGPRQGGDYEALIRRKGDEHEQAYLRRIEGGGRQIVEITLVDGAFEAAQAATLAAMREGAEVLYQATFARDGWRGRADFLERVPLRTDLGAWGYEAVDTKLARGDAKPHHVLQLGVYSAWIAEVQGVAPKLMHVELGSGVRESFSYADVAAYVRRVRMRFREFVADPPPTEALPCAHCQFCGYRSHCQAWWRDVDHLTRVATLNRRHLPPLQDAGITTLTQLADAGPDAAVPGIAPATVANLQWQARLQHESRDADRPHFEYRPEEPHRGFSLLPRPDDGDVFLDLEGDPLWDPARELWFLFGFVLNEDGEWRYRALWGHDEASENRAFEELVDVITARRREFPTMHVYHYSAAETSALRRLAAQPSTREAEVDDLLRAEVFVDLYQVLRQGLVIGAPSYGLKTTERLAGFTRHADVGAGADAIVMYERWRADHDQALLDEIARYNEEDCLATMELRDWLIGARPAGARWWTGSTEDEEPREVSPEQRERTAVRDQLATPPTTRERRLAGEAIEYHRREARPEWWQYFARLTMSPQELIDDSGAIGGLVPTGDPPQAVKRSHDFRLSFPPQSYGLGFSSLDPARGRNVNVVGVDDLAGVLTIRRGSSRGDEPLPSAVIPGGPAPTNEQKRALLSLGLSVRDETHRYRAAEYLLAAAPPRLTGSSQGTTIQTLDPAEQIGLAHNIDHGVLVVQGPPGTGKTWLGGRMIASLMRAGKCVGVTAVSHKAIENLVSEVCAAADEMGFTFRGVRKVGDMPGENAATGCVTLTTDNGECEQGEWDLIAGTAWLFCRAGMDQRVDHLVIDEAGQMSLADALAVATSARNVILLGDPQQLPHVSQAIHAPGMGASVLTHMLRGADTVPADRGLFLARTWRLHPDICDFLSREIYDGRLHAHPACAGQTTAEGTGLRFLPVSHTGCSSSSLEEAHEIKNHVERLVGTTWTGFGGQIALLTEADIMVVAPYNAQVRTLRSVLGPGVRVGTVDKFQGQEAPVVFFSMATSSGDDLPRDVEFLFSRNRLNVAISRARCLAYLVMSPALLDARPATVEDIRLISTLCALVEEAERQAETTDVAAVSG